ncbi:MAG: glycosyltransferase family 2 protein [Nitrospirae bacterium]|nr:glycosyltransferase family 2 protein [Nitrospirota bacterium]
MSDTEKVLTLVMPVYNEGDAVIPVVTTMFFAIRYPFKFIVVYDRDTDKTIATLNKLKQKFDDIYLVQNQWKQGGVVNAIRTGFNCADTPYVGIWLAYHVDPFGVINSMVDKLESGCDLVSASRFTSDTSRARGNTLKRLLSAWGNLVLDMVIGMPITDVTTSLKVYRKSLLNSLPIETVVNGGWSLSAELAIKAAIGGYKLAEVPLERKNVNLIHGLTNFKVFRQLPEYFRWLFLGWKNRKVIKSHLGRRI